MNDRKIIDSFTIASGYAFLSNFYPSTIWVNGKSYATVEHAYQSHKTLDENTHDVIRNANNPSIAKKLGRSVVIRQDWESEKIPLMRSFIKAKFESPFLSHLLLGTNDSILVNGNSWNDRVWGVCKGSGENMLGKILMEIREDLHHSLREA